MINALLVIFLLITIFSDLKYRKVFNCITLPAILLGFGLNILNFGLVGLKTSVLGLIGGFSLLFLFYLIGGMGAGDIKFMAAVGSLKGFWFTVTGGAYGAIAAGFIAIVVLIIRKKLLYTATKVFFGLLLSIVLKKKEPLLFDESDSFYIPYAAILSIGMFINLLV